MKKDPIKLRTVFMGTSFFAEEILSALIDSKYNIISVYTQPPKKIGQEYNGKKSQVATLAEKNKIRIYEPDKFSEAVISELYKQKPDLIIVAAYGKILPKKVLEIPGFGCINVHASLLPKYRGPSPIQNALLNGENETGSTIMLMDEGIDTGDILSQEKTNIERKETYPELSKKIAKVSARLILKTIPAWIERKIKSQKQENSKATLCQLIERNDGLIMWSNEAFEIFNRYRALTPWPGIFTFWKKNNTLKRLKLNKIDILENKLDEKYQIGEVFKFGNTVGVAASSRYIILEEIQIEGKRPMKIKEFLNGYPDFVGSILK